ncbi:IS1-like element transposase, partial [Escherichia coli]
MPYGLQIPIEYNIKEQIVEMVHNGAGVRDSSRT